MPTWTDYTRLTGQLNDLVHDQTQATAQQTRSRETATAGVGILEQRLANQNQRLQRLAKVLGQQIGQAPPTFTGISDPAQAIQLARQYTDTADATTAQVEQLAEQPRLLPGLSPVTRNLLVYGTCALLAVLAQYALLLVADPAHLDAITLIAWICTGFPAMAWIAGFVIISVWGRPYLGDPTAARNPKLGFAVCFLAMPAAFCAFKFISSMLGP